MQTEAKDMIAVGGGTVLPVVEKVCKDMMKEERSCWFLKENCCFEVH